MAGLFNHLCPLLVLGYLCVMTLQQPVIEPQPVAATQAEGDRETLGEPSLEALPVTENPTPVQNKQRPPKQKRTKGGEPTAPQTIKTQQSQKQSRSVVGTGGKGSEPRTAKRLPIGPGVPTVEEGPVPAAQIEEEEVTEEEKLLMEEWDMHMYDFTPADLMTFHLPARSSEAFFEDIEEIPSRLRGAWFVSSSESQSVDFFIHDPKGKKVFERKDKKEGIFYFDAYRRGTYQFKFSNSEFLHGKQITFAIHCGNNTDELLSHSHLSPLEESLVMIDKDIQDFAVDNQFAAIREESHYRTVQDANKNVFMLSLVECVGVIAMTAWQIYYIKKLLDNRRII